MTVCSKIKCIVLMFAMHLTNVSCGVPKQTVIIFDPTTAYPDPNRDNPSLTNFMFADPNADSPDLLEFIERTYADVRAEPSFINYNLIEYQKHIEYIHQEHVRYIEDSANSDPTGDALNKLQISIQKQLGDMENEVCRNAAQMEYGYEKEINFRYDAMCKSLRDHFDEYIYTHERLYSQSINDLSNVGQHCNYDLNAALREMQEHVKSFKDQQCVVRKYFISTCKSLIIKAVDDIALIIIRASSTKDIAEKNRDIVSRFKQKVIESSDAAAEVATMLSDIND